MELSPIKLRAHVDVLAADDMRGRQSDTAGIARARTYLVRTLADIGVQPLFPGYLQPFPFEDLDDDLAQGMNILGLIPGARHPETYLTLSAHYDHLGRSSRSGEIYSGADDNASGVACLLELARVLVEEKPQCSLVVCLFDGEESGLEGSKAFVARAPVPLEQIALEINMDMIGRADESLLWAAGARHSPWLAPHLDAIAAAVDVPLVLGHDRFSLVPGDNWTHESDHGSFHEAGIPWLHFGVSNHDDTHEPTDEAAAIDEEFFAAAARAILTAVRHFDAIGPQLLASRRAG